MQPIDQSALLPAAFACRLSLVIPAYNEAESLPELVAWIERVCEQHGITHEILIIDDGSSDNTWPVLLELKKQFPQLHAVRFLRNSGKSAALNTGFDRARGAVVITMDADLQDSPDEIPELMQMIEQEGYDLVSGWKKKRHDPLSKTLPTKLYNWATRKMSGIYLHDFNCGLKAYRNEVVKSIEVYGEMHRYIPVLARREGFRKIGEKVVEHRARKYGVTKFGWERFINGFLDLLTVSFISRFSKKPMHFFGSVGTLMFVLGFGLFAYIGGYKLWAMAQGIRARNITELSSFYIALTTMVLGTQLFLAGFVAELVGRADPNRNRYPIRDELRPGS